MKPIIKWSGSKRPLADEIIDNFPKVINTFYEPFCGSCSISLRLLERDDIQVNKIICSDVNKDLIGVWEAIKIDSNYFLIAYRLRWMLFNTNSKDETIEERRIDIYNLIKKRFNENEGGDLKAKLDKAHDFFFLLRTCFNGLVRYNKKGEFNTSCHFSRPGIHPDKLEKILEELKPYLDKIDFIEQDYRNITPNEDDYCFFDPPYSDTKGMYYGLIDEDELTKFLNNLTCNYALTFNAKRVYQDKPIYLDGLENVKVIELEGKNSSFNRLKGSAKIINEILYLKNGMA